MFKSYIPLSAPLLSSILQGKRRLSFDRAQQPCYNLRDSNCLIFSQSLLSELLPLATQLESKQTV